MEENYEPDSPVTKQPPYNRSELNSPDSFNSHSSRQTTPQKQSPQKQKHPNNQPYDPLIHTTNKPPLSFSSLIFLAIEDSLDKALPVKEIYAWIVAHYPYFKTAPTGWKNSVRHNLSLNKCFQKVEKAPVSFLVCLCDSSQITEALEGMKVDLIQTHLQNMGKGSLWRVEQQYKQNLIQALTRSSYHPCTAALDKTTYKTTPRPAESPPFNKVRAAKFAMLSYRIIN